MANASITTVQFLYKRVIDETIRTSRETFLNEGIEDSVLQELRTLWESKVSATRAVEPAMNPPDYIPRGQIYKYNYRNQPQHPVQVQGMPGSSVTPFPGHLSAFMPQSIQQQQTRPIAARPQVIPLAARQPQNIAARPHQQQPQNIAARPPTNQNRQNIAGSSSQYPSNIPFPSLSGVTTVTKKEFNNASDSIQVDGNVDCDQDQSAEFGGKSAKFGGKSAKSGSNKWRSGCGAVLEIRTSKKSGKRTNKQRSRTDGHEIVLQLDGVDSDDDVGDFVDSEESEEEEDNDDTDEEIDVEADRNAAFNIDEAGANPAEPAEEEDPLNSGDDDSDQGNTEFEATDNVVVCLFDKITRAKNKWKLYLKDGVMNISGKDHVFQKAIGDGEW